jgi:DNA polymerase-3 subunit delta'
MKFSDIPGLNTIKELLKQSVHSGKIPHAQLFAGASGCAALPMALAWSAFVHCQQRTDDACGVCPACLKNFKYIHPDTHYIFPAPSSAAEDAEKSRADNLKLWRSFLTGQPFGTPEDWITFSGSEDKSLIISREESRHIIRTLSLKPYESKYKIMLIWCAERMHPSAANALLKILEEPPPQTYFILISYAADHVLPTIRSRTQHVHIPLLSDPEMFDFLTKTFPHKTPEHLTSMVQMADGNVSRALRLEDHSDNEYHALLTEWLRRCYKKDFIWLVQQAEDFHSMERLKQHAFLRNGLTLLRESLIARAGASSLHRVNKDEQQFARKFAETLSIAGFEKAENLFNKADYHLERNGSAKMIFMDLSIRMTEIFRNTDTS